MAADTFRPNPAFSTAEVITQLGIGEALVSVLEAKGIPSMVGRTMIRPPSAQVGPITPAEREAIIAASPVAGLYDNPIDRDSAFEGLTRRARDKQLAEERQRQDDEIRKTQRTYQDERARRSPAPRSSSRQTPTEAAMNSLARTVANRLGDALVRGILGGLKRGR